MSLFSQFFPTRRSSDLRLISTLIFKIRHAAAVQAVARAGSSSSILSRFSRAAARSKLFLPASEPILANSPHQLAGLSTVFTRGAGSLFANESGLGRGSR